MSRQLPSRAFVPILSCLLASSSLATFAADAAAPAPYAFHETSILGTSLDLHVACADRAAADKVHKAVLAEIERLRKVLSTYDAASDLGRLNATRDAVKVSREVIDVLKLYEQWQKSSQGAFSGKLGAVIEQWKQAEKAGTAPAAEDLAKTVAAMKDPLWKIDEKAGTVQRLSDQRINIDSLGKGFIISRAAETGKKAAEIRGLLLNVGGDITAMGTCSLTDIEPWVVDVANPAKPADNAPPLVTLKIAGYSVATSASYERGYKVGSARFSHILDPRNGYPIDAEGPEGKRPVVTTSATVIARDNSAANALATSLSVLSPEEGMALIARTSGAEALLVLSDGRQLRSLGFSRFETVSQSFAGKTWPGDFEVTIPLQLANGYRDRPYVAVWVEDAAGKHVATIAEWGNNQRWINSLSHWWRFANGNDQIRAVSRATRPPGKYTLTWNGKDQAGNAVPAGVYKVCVEMAYEHNGRSFSTGTLTCAEKASTAVVAGTQHFQNLEVTFSRKVQAAAKASD